MAGRAAGVTNAWSVGVGPGCVPAEPNRMCNRAVFAGSKKKLRQQQRDERRVAAVKKRLTRIYELAKLLKNEEELRAYLLAIEDDAMRAEVLKLLEPFLPFKLKKIRLEEGITPDKITRVVLH